MMCGYLGERTLLEIVTPGTRISIALVIFENYNGIYLTSLLFQAQKGGKGVLGAINKNARVRL
jgi:hypothetical protein